MKMINLIPKWAQDWLLRDRAGNVEKQVLYGNQEWAPRSADSRGDLDAPRINANCFIATRAISDAIKGLPVHIYEIETSGAIDREVINSDHIANLMFKSPNTEHAWSDIVDYCAKAFLNDGNAILTIERNTGPNPLIELWPRDPRNVHINTQNRSYKFGAYTQSQIVYPRDRVIHIRDMDTNDPLWGRGRVVTVREEITMDYFINVFNRKFFQHGGSVHLMFTPQQNLTDDQHQQILDAMNADIGGVDNAFKLFINKYAGKLEFPEQKHKDMGFGELIKTNREKIFGVFGLPPFRGGVMEYANYANSLAQDADFWINTVKPVLKVIEDAFNKQLLWPLYGSDIVMRFDLSGVTAIQGDKNAQVDRLLKLKTGGVVSAQYVREQLGIEESAAPKEIVAPVSEDTPDMEGEKMPTDEEQEQVKNALASVFKSYRNTALERVRRLTVNGSLMSVLCAPKAQSARLYDRVAAFRTLREQLEPLLTTIATRRASTVFAGVGAVDLADSNIQACFRNAYMGVEQILDELQLDVEICLSSAEKFKWNLALLERRIKGTFSQNTAHTYAQRLARQFILDLKPALDKARTDRVVSTTLSAETTN